MRADRSSAARGLALCLAAAACTACATMQQAPQGFLPARRALGQETRGAWAVVTIAVEGGRPRYERWGELISIDEGQVRVLTAHGLVTLAEGSFAGVRVQTFEPRMGGAALGMALGTLSTLSHGGFLLLTAPAWLVVGGAGLDAERRSAYLKHPPAPLAALRAFARFPQGYPPGLPEADLGVLDARTQSDSREGR